MRRRIPFLVTLVTRKQIHNTLAQFYMLQIQQKITLTLLNCCFFFISNALFASLPSSLLLISPTQLLSSEQIIIQLHRGEREREKINSYATHTLHANSSLASNVHLNTFKCSRVN